MKPTTLTRSSSLASKLIVFMVLFPFIACSQTRDPKASKSPTTIAKKQGKEQKTADQKADSKEDNKPASVCDQYAEKLCEEVGKNTPMCQSIKSTLDLLPPNACETGMQDIDYSKAQFEKKRKVCDELVNKLCNDIGNKTETCAMVRKQTKNFDPTRCEGMMSQYPRVLEQVKRMADAEKPLTPEKQKLIADTKIGVFGPKNAKVTIVEFSDFQCPHCRGAAEAVNKLKKKYKDKIRIVFRHFPLPFHKDAKLAAQAALAAGAQGKFFEYHDLLFKNQRSLKREELEKYAKQLGLNMKKFIKALDDKTYIKTIEADLALGKEVGVQGTPSMYLNGKIVRNPKDFDAISKTIDKLIK